MKIKMKVDFIDGSTKELEARFADFVAFERTWNRSVTKFESELRLTDLAWIAWHVQIREKETAKQFDPEWLNDVDSLELMTDDEVLTPFDEPKPSSD